MELGGPDFFLSTVRTPGLKERRHSPWLQCIADDKDAGHAAIAAAGVKPLPGRFLDFLDPWGNRFEIVGCDNIQFTKAPHVLRGMGLSHLSRNEAALEELKDKGMAPS